MAFSPVLDLATGLVLIYFFFSVLCSAVVEVLARIFSMRQRLLAQGVYLLLGHDVPQGYFSKLTGKTTEAAGDTNTATPGGAAVDELPTRVLNHPLIRGLGQLAHELPSHIPPRTFALALLDELAPADAQGNRSMETLRESVAKIEPPALRRVLLAALAQAADNWDRVVALLQARFDNAMERVSDWYRRRSQWMLFLLGFVVAAAANVDSIHVAKSLWRDSTLRAALVAEVATAPPSPKAPDGVSTATATAAATEEAKRVAAEITLPIGWESAPKWSGWSSFLSTLAGLLLTAIALALGGPFWFDVLTRLASVRAATGPGREPPPSTAAH
ncbi:MAG TPA: hypothetical protein VNO21_14220 [Polyangiaceae bacterium]|nr:hypothetical protein [Polyangiaceae bacterium]